MKHTFKLIALAALGLFVSVALNAQMTTSSISGTVTDAQGAVPGAAVIAVHTPSGTQYYAVTNNEGRYTIQGMRPGGPYEVTVQLMGYNTVVYKDITLKLAETYPQDVALSESSEMLDEVIVVASTSKFKTEKTGASTNVSGSDIQNLPTTNRSIKDLTKLSPYASGMSFAGSDGRSTNFTVDGANFNNNFGLSSNLPGGGTPISVDAIEEVQLVVAPYDVRQSNFVGGGINAVTKSGTNTFKGTAYTYYTNQDFRGNIVAGEDLGARQPESTLQYGATLGGPIIKNKLFFFVNFEMQKQPEETINYRTDATAAATLEKIKNKLVNDYGYDPGSYTDYPGGIDNMKILARIDWNISDAHKLSVRYNNTKNTTWNAPNGNSCDDQFRNKSYNRASKTSFPFSNNMYSQQNDVMSVAVELNSRFGDKAANQLIATYTDINDQRGSRSAEFPHVDIMTGDYSSGNYIPFTSFGYELFTYNNGVKNGVRSVADNFTYYAGNHTITAGASWEYQTASNSYMRNGTGYYRFASAEDFLNGATPLSAAICYGYNGEENPRGEVTYNQFGVYAQDEWNATRNFKLTYGVRADGLFFDDSQLMTNNSILAYNMGGNVVDTGKWPNNVVQLSPRVGFVWDVFGDKSFKVRGGSGLFQGRLPLVFFTNMPQNAGMIQNLVSKGNYSASFDKKTGELVYTEAQRANLNNLVLGGKIITDRNEIISALGLPTSISADQGIMPSEINGVDPNFKMPQIWKSSVAVDYQLPVDFPFTVTAEGMFNKTIYGVRLVDWNLRESALDDYFKGPDARVNYRNVKGYKYGNTSAYVLTNTRQGWGYTANITINMTPARNLDIMAAYTRTESKEVSGMPGSAASSAYTGLYSVNGPSFTGLQRSQYVTPDKVIASVSYFVPMKAFGGNGLHLNLYYNAYSAGGYSYAYSNDMNGDGINYDLMYIPANKNELNFTNDRDRRAFWSFVKKDNYLSKHMGEYAEAYAGRAPWVHYLDLRVAQDFAFKLGNTTHKFQLSATIDNIGNMLNSEWGVAKYSCYSSYGAYTVTPLKYEGVNASGEPVFSMNKITDAKGRLRYPRETYSNWYTDPSQCWSVLFGLKYFFN